MFEQVSSIKRRKYEQVVYVIKYEENFTIVKFNVRCSLHTVFLGCRVFPPQSYGKLMFVL